jgi:hypothetical protein
MNTIDSILLHLDRHHFVTNQSIPKKDKRILTSLCKQISLGIFLTENQSKLLVKILTENIDTMRNMFSDIDTILASNTWSKKFRILQKIRKIGFDSEFFDSFVIEFTYNTRLKEKLSKISTALEGSVISKTLTASFLFPIFSESAFKVVLFTKTFFVPSILYTITQSVLTFGTKIPLILCCE